MSPVDMLKPCLEYSALAMLWVSSLSPKNASRSAVSPWRIEEVAMSTPAPKSESRGRMRARGTSRSTRRHVSRLGGDDAWEVSSPISTSALPMFAFGRDLTSRRLCTHAAPWHEETRGDARQETRPARHAFVTLAGAEAMCVARPRLGTRCPSQLETKFGDEFSKPLKSQKRIPRDPAPVEIILRAEKRRAGIEFWRVRATRHVTRSDERQPIDVMSCRTSPRHRCRSVIGCRHSFSARRVFAENSHWGQGHARCAVNSRASRVWARPRTTCVPSVRTAHILVR
jgi:hypothetical protein